MSDAETLRERLASDPRIRFALLYGSRAKKKARPDSDWDVALYLDEQLDAGARMHVQAEVLADLHPAIDADVIILNEAPLLLAAEALRGERLVVQDPVAFARFFVRTLGMVEDERHFARIHAKARRRRLEEGRFGRPGSL